jgi:signal transduction histidine kinase
MERQMDSIVHLVDDLMEISRITQGKIHLKLEDVDLGEAVHAAVRICQSPAVSRTRNLKVNVPGIRCGRGPIRSGSSNAW